MTHHVTDDPEIESDRWRPLTPATNLRERWRRFLDPAVRTRLSPGDDRVARFLVSIFPDGDVDRAEFWFASTLLLWGVWLGLPFETFTGLPRLYSAMGEIAGERTWAAFYFGAGLVHLSALAAERFGRRARVVWSGRAGRFLSAFGATFLWAFVAVMLASADWRSTGTPVYTWLLCGYNAWTLMRLVVHRSAVPNPW